MYKVIWKKLDVGKERTYKEVMRVRLAGAA
jgi:hypothetical protein